MMRATLMSVVLAVSTAAGAPAQQAAPASTVDSILPISVMIERFQAEAGARLSALPAGRATSRDALIRRFVRAIEDSNAVALHRLRLDTREYAWLYAPTSRMTQPPYRQPPQLGWMLVEQNGSKGAARVLRRFGGRPLGLRGYACSPPRQEGENTVWDECTLHIAARQRPIRLFGSILERRGRFKFISIANDL